MPFASWKRGDLGWVGVGILEGIRFIRLTRVIRGNRGIRGVRGIKDIRFIRVKRILFAKMGDKVSREKGEEEGGRDTSVYV